MFTEVLIEIYERDLTKLKNEIALYTNEVDLWITDDGISNSAGNLCLHIIGNLQHFFGTVLGETGYIRDREREFSDRNVPKDSMLAEIDATLATVKECLQRLSEEDYSQTYPIEVFGNPMTTGFFLVHLATHLNWHLGQINYHRRLMT